MRFLSTWSFTLVLLLGFLPLHSCQQHDNNSPDLLPKAPEHLLKNFLASPDSEPGDEDREFFLTEGGFLVSNGIFTFTATEQLDGGACAQNWELAPKASRVFDCFMFFNELSMLRLRLRIHSPVVDFFIISESTLTHAGKPKPMYFWDHRDEFKEWWDRIIYIQVTDLPIGQGLDSWGLENFQRNTLARAFSPGDKRVGLMSHLAAGTASDGDFSIWAPNSDDVILVADVDEIVKPNVLLSLSRCTGWTGPAFLYSRFYNFRFEWEFAGTWKHPQAIRFHNLTYGGGRMTMQNVRSVMLRERFTKFDDAGWHCSFFSGTEGVIAKIEAFAHQEFNNDQFKSKEAITKALDNGIDYFHTGEDTRLGGLTRNMDCEGLPEVVLQNLDEFKEWAPHCDNFERKMRGEL